MSGPLTEPGILHAELDLQREIIAKQAHDIVGTYNRADIFQLTVDTRRPTILQRRDRPDEPDELDLTSPPGDR